MRSLLFLIIFFCNTAFAVTDIIKETIEIEAAHIEFTPNVTIARGEVEITQGKQKVTAERIDYFLNTKQIFARGNVTFWRDDGNVFFADKLDLTDNFNKGVALRFKVRMQNDSAFAANAMEMPSKNIIKMYKSVFSPCKICPNNLVPNQPIWQISAKEAILDRQAQSIEYRDAHLQAFGKIPVLYTPYLITPAPGAKRKSGLLRPSIGPKHDFGLIIKQPVYFNLALNMDATITPIFTKNLGMIWEGEFRHLLDNGSYTIKGSITRPPSQEETAYGMQKKHIWRGHIDSKGHFSLQHGYWGYNLLRVIDKKKTYMQKYDYGEDDTLTSDLYYNNFNERDYLDIRAITFQGLRPEDSSISIPSIYPDFNMQKTFALPDGWNLQLFTNFLNLQRQVGNKYQRFVSELALNKQMVLGNGHVIETNAAVRGDIYQVINRNLYQESQRDGRWHPKFQATWRYPLYRVGTHINVALEPISSIVASPRIKNSHSIPNEDSQDAELSANILFHGNRFHGLDYIESGSWLDYGLRSNFNWHTSSNLGFLIGQSYHLTKPDFKLNDGSDSKSYFSDYVSNFYWQMNSNLTLLNRLRLNKKTLDLTRNEVNLYLKYPKWNAIIDYTSFTNRAIADYDAISKKTVYKHEVGLAMEYNLYDAWWIAGNMRRKLGHRASVNTALRQGAILESGGSLTYKGDCLLVAFSIQRKYTRFNDLTPGNTYSFSIDIPKF